MTSWGRSPTDKEFVVPVARRQEPRDPVTLEWVPILRSDGQFLDDTAQARFEHRDRRLWIFWITRMLSDNPLHGYGYNYYVQGTSSGCEPVRFLAKSIPAGKRTTEKFSNMPVDNYQILTADADGTTDNPVKGTVAQICIKTERHVRRSALPTDYDLEYDTEERTGRVNGSRIMLFPSQSEINDVLETVADNDAEIVERLIEENGLEDRYTRRQQATTPAPMQRAITTGAIYESRRQFGAAAAAMDAMCAPEGREERSIQL